MSTALPRDKLLIVGCGYTGERVAKKIWAIDPRRDISALVRRGSSLQKLIAMNIPAMTWDLDRPSTQETRYTLNQVGAGGVVLYSTPPPRDGEIDTRIKRFLSVIRSKVRHFVYLSTTGVYGDCQGEWIDESRPVNPQNDRSKRRLNAEEQVKKWCIEHQARWSILRIAGIYGPGRLPTRQTGSGDTVLTENEAPMGNHIHIDDLVRACSVLIQSDGKDQVINVSDGEPKPSGELRRVVAKAASLPPPQEIGIEQAHETFSEIRLSFALESRRINNQRLLDLLGGSLLYPNIEMGVAASLAP